MQAAMHKVFLVIQREYLARVKKKSFLVATLLTPLIFPAIMAVFVWIAVEEKENQSLRVIEVVDESGLFFMESSEQYAFSSSVTNLEEAKALVTKGERYGALYIPKMELSAPNGIQFYGLENPSTALVGYLEGALKRKIEDQKLFAKGIDPKVLKEIRTEVAVQALRGRKSDRCNRELCTRIFVRHLDLPLYFYLWQPNHAGGYRGKVYADCGDFGIIPKAISTHDGQDCRHWRSGIDPIFNLGTFSGYTFFASDGGVGHANAPAAGNGDGKSRIDGSNP